MTKNNFCSEESLAIDWLRFPLMICVVFIHSFNVPAEALPIDWTSLSFNDVYTVINVFFSRIITHSAVPCFYFISGYLFFLNISQFNKTVWQKKMKSRVRTLLVPYLLWNAIFIVAIAGKDVLKCLLGMENLSDIAIWFNEQGGLPGLFWNCNVWGEDAVNWLGQAQRSSGPIDLPLWFLRDLIVVTLLTPIIHWLVKHCGIAFIAVLGLAFVSKVWPLIDGLSITAIFFFSIGAYMGERKISISVLLRWEKPIYLIAVLLALISTYLGGPDTAVGNIVFPFFRIAGVPAALCLALRFHSRGHVKWPVLTHSVFFIYALHGLYIIGYYFGGMFNELVADSNMILRTLVYLLVPFIKIAACAIIYIIMKRITPRLLSVLTGSRS